MQTILCGSADTIHDARSRLNEAGYHVNDVPTTLELAEGEAALSVEGQYEYDIASVVSHLGWTRRGVTGAFLSFPMGFGG